MSSIVIKAAKFTVFAIGSTTLLSIGAVGIFALAVQRSLSTTNHFENSYIIADKIANGPNDWSVKISKKQ